MTANALTQPPELLGIGTRAYAFASIANLAVAAASAQSGAVDATEVCLYSTTACYVCAGADPTATVTGAGSFPLPAGLHFHIRILPGWKIAAIRATADGSLSIIPVA